MTLSSPVQFRYLSPWLIGLTVLWRVIFFTAFDHPVDLFLRNGPLIIAGIARAFIGNITAIGGGIAFVPVIMFVYKTDPAVALKPACVERSSFFRHPKFTGSIKSRIHGRQ